MPTSRKHSLRARIALFSSLISCFYLVTIISENVWSSGDFSKDVKSGVYKTENRRSRHLLEISRKFPELTEAEINKTMAKFISLGLKDMLESYFQSEGSKSSNVERSDGGQKLADAEINATVAKYNSLELEKQLKSFFKSLKAKNAAVPIVKPVVKPTVKPIQKPMNETNLQNVNKSKITCTPPAYHEFPTDLFTSEQRSRGAIIVHALVVLYMFYALAAVCDDYFVCSLEKCCQVLDISEDVAGATFMAVGSSAPELFTAILGVFVTKGDVGTGTIVGSAVFNILFVVGVCGIFAGQAVPLNWWPLFRDSVFYSFTVITLIIIIFDSVVTWVESLMMLLLYCLYIVTMKFNSKLHNYVLMKTPLGTVANDLQLSGQSILPHGEQKCYNSYVPFNNEIDQVTLNTNCVMTTDESIKHSIRRWTLYEASLRMLMTRHFRPITRFRFACIRIIHEHRFAKNKSLINYNQVSIEMDAFGAPHKKLKIESKKLDEWKRIPTRDDGIIRIVKWIVETPVFVVLYYTIPDCSKDRWSKWFMVTFINSVLWIAIFSYIMVWMVTLIGYTLNIPDTIMGITFLAAGTSVPDAMASYIVAKQGQGDMAVSNTIGSNIFDILVGLALPWFLQTSMVKPGSTAHINSKGMIYSVILLFMTIIVTIGGVHYCRWQLTPRLGMLLLSVYAVFLVISILTEYNVLGYVNPPMCME